MKKILSFLLLMGLFLTACTNTQEELTEAASLDETPTQEVELVPQETATEMVENTPVPTEDTRMLPEEWMAWPVIPELTNTAINQYNKGKENGVNPNAFSKVGDCQNLKTVFLWKYDHMDIYTFEWDIEPYLDTINNFQGYFDRDGQSAEFGFTAASPLSQLQADPAVCQPDETPLACEMRITRPMFVLISLEFPFNGRSADLYRQYLTRIIEYTLEQGAIPILATKADNVEKDHSINLTIAELAYQYDLPLWNWWAAAQPLGDHGIDPYRDGFHISEQAWEERSKTFLQVLDHLWEETQHL